MKGKKAEHWARPGMKAKQAEYMKQYMARPGMKAKQAEYMKQYRARPEVKSKRAEYDARPEVWAKRAKYNEKAEYDIIKKSEQIVDIIKRQGFANIIYQKGIVLYVPPGYIQSTAAQGPVPVSDRFGDQVGRRP